MSLNAPRERMTWMDAVRGFAILLVVFRHAAEYANVFDWPPMAFTMDALTPYRMPLLLTLSGMLLPASLRKPLTVYYVGKARKIVWPYLLWGIVLALVTVNVAGLITVEYWREGPYYLWFLAVLIFAYLVGPVARVVPPWLVVVGFLAVLVVLDPSTNLYRRFLFWGAYFFLGAAAIPHLRRIAEARVWLPALTAPLGIAAAIYVGATGGSLNHTDPWTFLLPLPGVVAAIWFASRLPRVEWLEYLGRTSIVFYTAHIPALILVALATSAVGLPGWASLPILLLAGFGVPFALASFDRWSSWMFAFPVSERRRTQAAAPVA